MDCREARPIFPLKTPQPLHFELNILFLPLTKIATRPEKTFTLFKIAHQRVQKQLDGLVAITSDNKNYRDMTIPVRDLSKLKIIGRVV